MNTAIDSSRLDEIEALAGMTYLRQREIPELPVRETSVLAEAALDLVEEVRRLRDELDQRTHRAVRLTLEEVVSLLRV